LTELEIPANVTTITSFTFIACSSLRQVKIPLDVTAIGWQAFSGCSHLEQLEIPLSVTTIESWTFNGCSCLEQLEIPPSVTTIETGAFMACSGLTRLHIPLSVKTLMDQAFDKCTGLKELQIPASICNLAGSDVFHGVKKVELLTLLGSTLSSRFVANVKGCLTPMAQVIGPALAERAEARSLHDHRHVKEKVPKLCIFVWMSCSMNGHCLGNPVRFSHGCEDQSERSLVETRPRSSQLQSNAGAATHERRLPIVPPFADSSVPDDLSRAAHTAKHASLHPQICYSKEGKRWAAVRR
jgi:hypothetical protein